MIGSDPRWDRFTPRGAVVLATSGALAFGLLGSRFAREPWFTPDSEKYVSFSPVIPHGYSLLLAVYRTIAPDYAYLPLVQLLFFGCAALLLCLAVARRLDSVLAGAILLGLTLLYSAELEAFQVMSDPPYAALVTLAVASVMSFMVWRRSALLIGASWLLAFAMIVRPIGYAMVPAYVAAVFMATGCRTRRALTVLVLCLLPFPLFYAAACTSNFVHNGQFRVGSWGGVSLLGKGLVLATPRGASGPLGDIDWIAAYGGEARDGIQRVGHPLLRASVQRLYYEYLRWFVFFPALEDQSPVWRSADAPRQAAIATELAIGYIREDPVGYLGLVAHDYASLWFASRVITPREKMTQEMELASIGELPLLSEFARQRREAAFEYYRIVPRARHWAYVVLTRLLVVAFLGTSLAFAIVVVLSGDRVGALRARLDVLVIVGGVHATYAVTALVEGALERYLAPTWPMLMAGIFVGVPVALGTLWHSRSDVPRSGPLSIPIAPNGDRARRLADSGYLSRPTVAASRTIAYRGEASDRGKGGAGPNV